MTSLLPSGLSRSAAALAAVALLPAPAGAQEYPGLFAGVPGIVFRFYDVAGTTPSQIFASLRAQLMRRPDGSSAAGLTQWRMNFRWQEREDIRGARACQVRDAVADMRITITLPRLATPDRATPAALAQWRRYVRTLEEHEAGHVRIAWAHRDDFSRAAAGVACADIKDVGRRVMARVVDIQTDYDRRTRHGQDQGRDQGVAID